MVTPIKTALEFVVNHPGRIDKEPRLTLSARRDLEATWAGLKPALDQAGQILARHENDSAIGKDVKDFLEKAPKIMGGRGRG